jgi:hypothetical protein
MPSQNDDNSHLLISYLTLHMHNCINKICTIEDVKNKEGTNFPTYKLLSAEISFLLTTFVLIHNIL